MNYNLSNSLESRMYSILYMTVSVGKGYFEKEKKVFSI